MGPHYHYLIPSWSEDIWGPIIHYDKQTALQIKPKELIKIPDHKQSEVAETGPPRFSDTKVDAQS